MSMSQEQITVDLFNRCKELEQELATLRAKSKAYDDGQEAWAVKCPSGQLAHTGTQDECSRKCADLNAADMFLDGREYTYIKVRVCKEVEKD